ncbi:hypothetical protein SPRG_04737 [Saprolegnia parasitica CBS 223.65]|uniref:Uncharacterized protein n=1 Tax=Saprolegnia parasitica (strain CBS 223.65) TaxID=695850 RepID=A0A067CWD7_SAPPC|nr:hypothetical protein SPRG_04737 [Saprolegnia parasitica CBS 223.65]KDO30836.1 hypothetical protein SPRG_04737 [Saprolegnia parasitica CBS 223.65]|eukprot:XP_012198533.1 hypothetical protein SPRG_04737 [Saprolegnia parasitica CBS 223.65]
MDEPYPRLQDGRYDAHLDRRMTMNELDMSFSLLNPEKSNFLASLLCAVHESYQTQTRIMKRWKDAELELSLTQEKNHEGDVQELIDVGCLGCHLHVTCPHIGH